MYRLYMWSIEVFAWTEDYDKRNRTNKIVTVYGHEYCREDLFIELVKKMNNEKNVKEYIQNIKFFY